MNPTNPEITNYVKLEQKQQNYIKNQTRAKQLSKSGVKNATKLKRQELNQQNYIKIKQTFKNTRQQSKNAK